MNARDRVNGRATPAPPSIPTIQVDLAADPTTGHWTASVAAFGAFGEGATPGTAVDALLYGLKPRIDAIAALDAAGAMTANWKDRRLAMAKAQKLIMGAALAALVDLSAILAERRAGAAMAAIEGVSNAEA